MCVTCVCGPSRGEAYIHGPYFIPPLEVQHTPTRLFYQREVFLSAVEDTNPMTSIVDRCAVLSHREFCTERPTQVTEECVYLCESKYSEMEKSIKKFNKPLKVTSRDADDNNTWVRYCFCHKYCNVLCSPFIMCINV